MCACYAMSVFAATGGAKEQPVGAGMVREFPAPVSEVRQAVQGVVGDHSIHGTRVFDKDPILTGGEAVPTTPLFAAWAGPGEAARLESPAKASAEEKFTGLRMEREETSMFPGDWAALKGKTVKIYTVQPVSQNPTESGPGVPLNYSLALFQKGLKEAAGANPAPEGIVVIFGSADGGIAGATLAEIQRMVKGTVSREAFWTQSDLDPVKAFRAAHP
jgi:hypothetical protein